MSADDATADPFATLVVKKLLLPSQKTKYVAVEMGFLIAVMRDRLERIHVDETWYLDCNPDVCDAVRDGVVRDAREHFVTRGFYEHRLPYEITVDAAWYLAQYEDVCAAVEAAVFPSAQAHFESVGYREGRLPFAGFRLAPAGAGCRDRRGSI